MPFTITLAGQDISQYVDQNTINIQDTLGQGGGAGSGSMTQGRASIAKFNAALGPAATAYGAGQTLPPVTTNLYPSATAMATDASAITLGGGVSAGVDASQSVSGGTSYKVVTNGGGTFQQVEFHLNASAFAAGQTYTFSIYQKGAGSLRIYTQASTGSIGSVTTYSTTNTWTRYNWTVTMPNPITATYIGIRLDTGSTAQALTYWLDNLQIEAGSVVTPFHVGTTIPSLVRQGEVIVKDSTGTIVWGGFATKLTDTTTSVLGQNKQPFTTIEGVDYSTSLQRTLVNVSFSAATDIFIIRSILKQYAPWINLAYLPANPGYLFPIKNFRNVSVEQVLQTVAGITGYLVYVDYLKYVHYIPPTQSTSAPYNLSSNPNFLSTFPHAVTEYLVDDNSAINRVWFYGGTKLSNDITQDVSPMANGNNKIFTVAYFASAASDGKYHVILNGVEQAVGTANATGAANTLISAGGTAQVIIDPGSRSVTFDVAPASGATVLFRYRYSYPLSLLLTDENSHKFFGDPYLDGYIDDNTIFDLATAVQRCKVLLAQQNYGLVSFKVDVYNKPGVQAGMVIHIDNALRGINGTYLIQEVVIEALGGDNYVYHLSLGAWNWNLIDFLLKLPTLATFQDNQQETTEQVIIQSIQTNIQVRDTWSKKTSSPPYYARAAVVGDGHDAYPGFSTITS